MQDSGKGAGSAKRTDTGCRDLPQAGAAADWVAEPALTPADLRGLLPRPERPATIEEMDEAVAEAATASGG